MCEPHRTDADASPVVHGASRAALYDFGRGEVVLWDGAGPTEGLEMPREVVDTRPRFAWLELTQACDLRCVHCYTSSMPRDPGPRAMTRADWMALLGALRREGVDQIQFIGGEPLLSPHLEALLLEAGRLRFRFIELFTNCQRLSERILNLLVSMGAHLATTLYSGTPAIHDAVTGVPGSFTRTTEAVRKARAWGIPVRIGCIVTPVNEPHLAGMEALVLRLGARYTGAEPARPTGRGTSAACRPTFQRAVIKAPFATSRPAFARNRALNPCWAGKLAVTEEGNVIPCVFARECIAGNLRERAFPEVLDTLRERYWKLTKDHIETCRDCEYRYACGDCRPLAMAQGGGRLDAKTAGCGYAPHEGVWRHPHCPQTSATAAVPEPSAGRPERISTHAR